jgi:hypothetical protein
VSHGSPRDHIWANQNEVIVHNLAPNRAETTLHKLQFPCFVVHEHNVTFADLAILGACPVPTATTTERGPGKDCGA